MGKFEIKLTFCQIIRGQVPRWHFCKKKLRERPLRKEYIITFFIDVSHIEGVILTFIKEFSMKNNVFPLRYV